MGNDGWELNEHMLPSLSLKNDWELKEWGKKKDGQMNFTENLSKNRF